MPRRKLGARLYFRKDDKTWVIRDGEKQIRTGFGLERRDDAEIKLKDYLANKYDPPKREGTLARITVDKVLTVYGLERAQALKDRARAGDAIIALKSFDGWQTLADIRGNTCRRYWDHRRRKLTQTKTPVSDETIRRELSVLSAAIKHWHAEYGPLDAVPIVSKPPRGEPRPDYMTRSQAAAILAGFLGWSYDEKAKTWSRNRANALPHMARFFLLGIHTGTRSGAIMSLQWLPNMTGGWVDFERGILHRRGRNVGQTKKRQPQAKIGRRLLAHLERWRRIDDAIRTTAANDAGEPVKTHMYIVSWAGRPMEQAKTGWRAVLARVGMERMFTPHHMRHTRATWLMQEGVDMWEAAGNLGMSMKTLETVYAHHRPDWQKRASEV